MSSPDVVAVAALTFWTILVVEIVGDKAVYTVTSLASRYPAPNVYAGISCAFAAKMGAAVIFGHALLQLPSSVTATISACTFFATGVGLWRERSSSAPAFSSGRATSSGVAASFAALFFSEWADLGQLAAAALAARYQMPLVIWAAATLALMTKGLGALTLGIQLRRRMPAHLLQLAAAASCGILGILALGAAFVR